MVTVEDGEVILGVVIVGVAVAAMAGVVGVVEDVEAVVVVDKTQ